MDCSVEDGGWTCCGFGPACMQGDRAPNGRESRSLLHDVIGVRRNGGRSSLSVAAAELVAAHQTGHLKNEEKKARTDGERNRTNDERRNRERTEQSERA